MPQPTIDSSFLPYLIQNVGSQTLSKSVVSSSLTKMSKMKTRNWNVQSAAPATSDHCVIAFNISTYQTLEIPILNY